MSIANLVNVANQLACTLDIQLKGRPLKFFIFNSSNGGSQTKPKILWSLLVFQKARTLGKKLLQT